MIFSKEFSKEEKTSKLHWKETRTNNKTESMVILAKKTAEYSFFRLGTQSGGGRAVSMAAAAVQSACVLQNQEKQAMPLRRVATSDLQQSLEQGSTRL